jgi:hypothetical protein
VVRLFALLDLLGEAVEHLLLRYHKIARAEYSTSAGLSQVAKARGQKAKVKRRPKARRSIAPTLGGSTAKSAEDAKV